MQAADRFAKLEQRAVGERKQRTAQRRKDREFVVGPLDRGERIAQRLDLLAFIKRAASHQHVRYMTRLERTQIRPRDVAAIGVEAAKKDTDVARAKRNALSRCVALCDGPSTFVQYPAGKRRSEEHTSELQS